MAQPRSDARAEYGGPDEDGPPTGDALRRHLRDAHHFDRDHVEIAPEAGLICEHEFHHEDGLDMEEHTHGDDSDIEEGSEFDGPTPI